MRSKLIAVSRECLLASDFEEAPALPQSVDEWYAVLNLSITKARQVSRLELTLFRLGWYVPLVKMPSKLSRPLCSACKKKARLCRGSVAQMWAAPSKYTLQRTPANSRARMRANHIANVYAGVLRKAVAPFLHTAVGDKQSGAIKGGGTEFPMFIATLVL